MTFVMGFKAGSDSVWVRDQGTIKESLRLEYTMSVCFCCGISYDLNGFKTFLFSFAIRIMWRRRLSEYIAELVGKTFDSANQARFTRLVLELCFHSMVAKR